MKRIFVTEQQFKQIIAKNLIKEYSFNHNDWIGRGNMAQELGETLCYDHENDFLSLANGDEEFKDEVLDKIVEYINANESAFEITTYGSTDYEPETNGYTDDVSDYSGDFVQMEKVLRAAPIPPEFIELTIKVAKEVFDNFDDFKYEEDEPDYYDD